MTEGAGLHVGRLPRADGARHAEWLGGLPACIPGLDTYRNTDTKSQAA